MTPDELQNEDDYVVINSFLKALAHTIVDSSKHNHDRTQSPYSPHQFLQELARIHQREILYSPHSSERVRSHSEEAASYHSVLADFVDALEQS